MELTETVPLSHTLLYFATWAAGYLIYIQLFYKPKKKN